MVHGQQRTPLAQTCFMELMELAEAPRIGAFNDQGTVIEMIASGRDMQPATDLAPARATTLLEAIADFRTGLPRCSFDDLARVPQKSPKSREDLSGDEESKLLK
jgi:hypothetical protein